MDTCQKCKTIIDPTEIYGDWFYCKVCQKEWTYQPERSKREDIDDLGHIIRGVPTTEESWCVKCGEETHVIISSMMRCSEHGRDVVRPAETIWPAEVQK